jgi:hypothetical protein
MSTSAKVLLILALVLGLAPPAAAGTADEPEVQDPCGVEEVTDGLVPDAPAPWTDVCAAWIETLTGETGPPALRITVALAGDVESRPTPSSYHVAFRVADCRFTVTAADEGSLQAPEGVELVHGCDPAYVDEPCEPPYDAVMTCRTATPTSTVPLPAAAVVADGSTLAFTLVFAGGLAPWAADVAEGAVLRRLSVSASPIGMFAGGYCIGAECGAGGGDVTRPGADYVVEAGDGPAVEGPIAEVAPQLACTPGPAADGSADRPHAVDPVGVPTHLGPPAADAPAYDLRALWFGVDEVGATTLSILPSGPEHVPGELMYVVWVNGAEIWAHHASDGTWSATAYEDGPSTEPRLEGAPVAVAHDPSTGEVRLTLPTEALPEPGGDLVLTGAMSHFAHYGSLAGSEREQTSTSVDDLRDGGICAATR